VAVDDRQGLSGVVDEQLLAGDMHLAHRQAQRADPGAVEIAEAAVAIACGEGALILLPEQPQGHALAFEFLVDVGPVGQRALVGGDHHGWREQQPFQPGLIEIFGQRPG